MFKSLCLSVGKRMRSRAFITFGMSGEKGDGMSRVPECLTTNVFPEGVRGLPSVEETELAAAVIGITLTVGGTVGKTIVFIGFLRVGIGSDLFGESKGGESKSEE